MKKTIHILARFACVAALLGILCSACSSGEHMYRHRRSDCDCPRFD